MKVKVAAVQPESFHGAEEHKNVDRALAYVDEAAALGAQLVCFPEGYPGPYSGPLDSGGHLRQSPIQALCGKARDRRVYISAGNLEPNHELADTYFITHKLIAPDGQVLANYRRVQPNHPCLNAHLMGGRLHVLPGNEFVVLPTELGRIGLLICSELFVPELARILMLRGADIILAPGGGTHHPTHTRVREAWLCVARARAVENLVYVVVTQNLFYRGVTGRTAVVGPEGTLAEKSDAGLAMAELDLARLDELRSRYYDEEMLGTPEDPSKVWRTRPGQCHDRRPELYGDLVRPQPDAFDYRYDRRGLDRWREEYEKIRRSSRPSLG